MTMVDTIRSTAETTPRIQASITLPPDADEEGVEVEVGIAVAVDVAVDVGVGPFSCTAPIARSAKP